MCLTHSNAHEDSMHQEKFLKQEKIVKENSDHTDIRCVAKIQHKYELWIDMLFF